MSSVPQTTSEQPVTPVQRSENVFMGHQDYVSVLLRLTGAELYKLRRRPMSKVLSIIAICTVLLGLSLTGLQAFFANSAPVSAYLAPPCGSIADTGQDCLSHAATQADYQQAEAAKQANLYTLSSPLRLPESFLTSSQIIQGLGLVLIIILAGTIVGGEYGIGTIRVLYTRGPTRTQFLLAKALSLLTCTVVGVIVLTLAGILMGGLLSLILGQPIDFSFFTAEHMLHAAAYLGIIALGLLIYALIALFISTLGKATAAGLAGALLWWGLESILGGIFLLMGSVTKGILSNILKAVPDYFISNNINTLLNNQQHYLSGDEAGTGSDLHAILVLLAYVIIFIGSACLINKRRDVTN
ncbi:MAG TPA: ABC transporter permease [Ktedonobacteraceae bacterium]|jgi:ABC-type transport system involved in multi-copper enzyme maturation permease subunit|nr:ABC transporter permease [Ktedonobacteraceae bacterium]